MDLFELTGCGGHHPDRRAAKFQKNRFVRRLLRITNDSMIGHQPHQARMDVL
ncbi:MAG: hypothetical protein NXI04_06110 [Planctomycetaceae bacterium]|nr:hypothetical protein [Planctomycetaceae bacterium]